MLLIFWWASNIINNLKLYKTILSTGNLKNIVLCVSDFNKVTL